eukprot:TRINITY_DN28922_c0_g1_i1.p1 TRINITY_DN28922_c0_g1~~TRINITY_DN28922_c0_g1_i1.p1  ORF type:complete len:88 (+),score=2.30 TRINITY_DN28922_c0_g1_i1:39-302(+)
MKESPQMRKRQRNDTNEPPNSSKEESSHSQLIIMAIVFLSALFIVYTVFANTPTLEKHHRDKLHLPKSLSDVKEISDILSIYTENHY